VAQCIVVVQIELLIAFFMNETNNFYYYPFKHFLLYYNIKEMFDNKSLDKRKLLKNDYFKYGAILCGVSIILFLALLGGVVLLIIDSPHHDIIEPFYTLIISCCIISTILSSSLIIISSQIKIDK